MTTTPHRQLRIHKGAFLVRPHARGFPAHVQKPLSEYVRQRERDLTAASHERLLTGVSIASLRETPKEQRNTKEFRSAMNLAKNSIAGQLATFALEHKEFADFIKTHQYFFVNSTAGITMSERQKVPFGKIRVSCEDILWLMSHMHLS